MKQEMEKENDDGLVTVGISIPVSSSEEYGYLYEQQYFSAIPAVQNDEYESSDISLSSQFNKLHSSLDPNLGILGTLSSTNMSYEKSTFNSWNIDPHFLHDLPLSASSINESFILLFGGLNPLSMSNKGLSNFDHEDFVLGSTVFQYLLNSAVWKYYGTMFEPRCYHASVLLGQYVYIIGGYSLLKCAYGEMIAMSSTDRLNLDDGQWKRCANMITARAAHAAVCHKNSLYVFGGRNSQGEILSSVEVYYPDQDMWAEISFLPRPAMGLSAVCAMDEIWILGGITANDSTDPSKCLLSDVLTFNPLMKRWTTEESLPHPCAYSVCISNGHSLWMIGGCTFSKKFETNLLASCSSVLKLVISTRPSKWKSVGSLLNPRHAATAILYDERIYILGGMESSRKCSTKKVEVFNFTTNMSIETSDIPVAITGSASVLIRFETKDYTYTKDIKIDKELGTLSDLPHAEEDFSNIDKSLNISRIEKDVRESDTYEKSDLKTEVSESKDTNYKSVESHRSERILSHEDLKEKVVSSKLIDMCRKEEENETVRYRASMEIFLNSMMVNRRTDLNLLEKSTSAIKWQNYFSSFSAFEEKLQKEKLKTKQAVAVESFKSYKEERETSYVSDVISDPHKTSLNLEKSPQDLVQKHTVSVTGQTTSPSPQQSLLYIQSNLKSQSSIQSCTNDFLDKRSEHSSHSDKKSTELKESELDILCNKISIVQGLPIILIMGGEDPFNSTKSRYILSYECKQNLWKYAGYLPEYRCHHCSTYFHHKYYVLGGFASENSEDFGNITKKVICYDILNEMWCNKASMNNSRAFHSAVIFNDEIWVVGGRDQSGNILSSVEVYNESRDEWREYMSLPYAILGAATTVVNNTLFIFGGISYKEENEIISSNMTMLESENSRWKIGSDMHIPLAFCGIASFSNSVWLFGGLKEDNDEIVSGKDVFQFDALTETWNKVAELSVPRHAAVTVSLDSKVYIIGGHSTQDKREVITCEEMSLLNNELSPKKSLPIAVSGKAGAIIAEAGTNE